MRMPVNFTVRTQNFIYTSFDICALIISVIVLANYLASKKIERQTSKLFVTLTVSVIISTVVNLLGIILISVTGCPLWLASTVTVLNYVAYNITGVVFVVFTAAVFYEGSKMPRFMYMIANGVFILAILGAVFAAIALGFKGVISNQMSDNLKIGYESVVYGAQLIALASSLALTVIHRSKVTSAHKFNIYAFCALNLVAVVLQFVLKRIMISNFALAIAILLLYITLQRPEDEIDAVSGAFNARAFRRRGNALLEEGKSFYVFALELNNMTVINSSFGLAGGNEVIREIATRLKRLLVKGQYLYRLNGVRFVTVFRSRELFDRFLEKYPTVFEQPVAVENTEMQLTGIACLVHMPEITDKLSEVEDLLRYYRTSVNASEKVIEATADEMAKARRREMVDYAIQNAINNKTFKVFYQPIYSVEHGEIRGCEALLRLNDPTLGNISPDEFIPISEQNGKIIEVGKMVIEEVCRFIKDNSLNDYMDFVDINLSVIQCMHPEIINDIETILNKYQVPRSMVNLEITETASTQSYALLQTKVNELHSNGFTISLDDFGTGFASVEYLINFPFEVVKLDKSLVWAYMSTKKYELILQHYMPMLHSLGTKIVAEGVETKEMVDALIGLGCDYLQGYYYSRPIPENEFLEYVKKGSKLKTA